jgi:hypothetical protein
MKILTRYLRILQDGQSGPTLSVAIHFGLPVLTAIILVWGFNARIDARANQTILTSISVFAALLFTAQVMLLSILTTTQVGDRETDYVWQHDKLYVIQGLISGTTVAIISALVIAFVMIASSLHCDGQVCLHVATFDERTRVSQSVVFTMLSFFALVVYNIVQILQNLVVGIIATERRKVKRQIKAGDQENDNV